MRKITFLGYIAGEEAGQSAILPCRCFRVPLADRKPRRTGVAGGIGGGLPGWCGATPRRIPDMNRWVNGCLYGPREPAAWRPAISRLAASPQSSRGIAAAAPSASGSAGAWRPATAKPARFSGSFQAEAAMWLG